MSLAIGESRIVIRLARSWGSGDSGFRIWDRFGIRDSGFGICLTTLPLQLQCRPVNIQNVQGRLLQFEGRTNFMYRCTGGEVTVGVGHALTGELPEFTCFAGTIIQEAYRTHPEVSAACGAR